MAAGLLHCRRLFPSSHTTFSSSLRLRRLSISEHHPCPARCSARTVFAVSAAGVRALSPTEHNRKSKPDFGAGWDGREGELTAEVSGNGEGNGELERAPAREDSRWVFGGSELPKDLHNADVLQQVGISETKFSQGSGSTSTVSGSPIYHNVEDGETLTSIARRYRTLVHLIAEMNDIRDIDSLQSGQVLLIPFYRTALQKTKSISGNLREGPASKYTSRRVPIRLQSQNAEINNVAVTDYPPMTILSSIKALIPVLLLVLVFGFCVRSILDGLYSKLRSDVSKQQAEKEVWTIQHRPKLKRWQTILDEDRETEESGFSPANHADPTTETEEQRRLREFEEIRNQYSSLETTYMKFLVDSGLARSGYWRGGVSSAAQDRDTR